MYEIAICDDDSVFASDLQKQLAKVMQERDTAYRLSLFSGPDAFLTALESGEHCDLVFLDIVFGSEKGIRFAKYLRGKSGMWMLCL